MKRITIVLLLLLTMSLSGQEKGNWLGIRGGYTPGLELRHYFSNTNSGRLLLGYRQRGLLLHGLYEVHIKNLIPSNEQFSFIYGAGAHTGFISWNKTEKQGTYYLTRTVTRMVAGIDGLIAVEYDLGFVPLTAGIEVKPFLEIGGNPSFQVIPWDFAFTLKLPL